LVKKIKLTQKDKGKKLMGRWLIKFSGYQFVDGHYCNYGTAKEVQYHFKEKFPYFDFEVCKSGDFYISDDIFWATNQKEIEQLHHKKMVHQALGCNDV